MSERAFQLFVSQTKSRIWCIEQELKSYSILLTHMNDDELVGAELLGLGLSLRRISLRLRKLQKDLERCQCGPNGG